MSKKLISLSPDLQRLRDEGYELDLKGGFLILNSIPYVNSKCEVASGSIVTDLAIINDQTQVPNDHQVWFAGEHPCNKDGTIISAISHSSSAQTLCEGLVVNHRFSCKPQGGYPNYYEKMTRYVEIITNQARAIDSSCTARTFKPVKASDDESIFLYTDTSASRAGITHLTMKSAMEKIAFVGLGGTGSYVFDLVSKTHTRELHLFDGAQFSQHNAFRAPGAASLETLNKRLSKVDYYYEIYSQMRRGIIPHNYYIDNENVSQLAGFNFVFLCVDNPAVRKLISNFLHKHKIPFIDVGMEMEYIEEYQCLIGSCRATLSTPEKYEHYSKHVSLIGEATNDLYDSNIQVAEINAMNATMAVIKWKKLCGYYQDIYNEHQSTYVINTHQLSRDEISEGHKHEANTAVA